MLRRSGKTVVDTRQELINSEGIQITRQAISSFLERYRQTGSLSDVPKEKNRPSRLNDEHMNFIDI